jgi:hypothetical protein
LNRRQISLKETLRIATLILVIGLIALSLFSPAKSQVPLPPVVIEGYVTIQTVSGTNITAPAGLNVYTKQQNTTIPNTAGSTPTDASGFYLIAVGNTGNTVPPEGAQIDIWVQGINVTRIIFSYHNNPVYMNLTLIDKTAPTIQIISPQPQTYVSSTVPVWVNATVTDDLAINATSIKMTLNQTQLVPTFDNTTGLLSNQTGPLTQGLYVANITVSDIAGNTAVQTWNFTASPGVPPTVSITSPTATSPVYTQSGKPVQVTFTYTEPSPLNWTITISNATYTAASVSNTTAITPGTITTTVSVTISPAAPEGTYNVAVTMYNNYGLSTTASQTNAVVIDNTSPSVSTAYQNPPGQLADPTVTLNVSQGTAVTVSVNVTDASSGVKQAVLSYNNGAGWVNQTMSGTGSLYTATIPGQPAGTAVTYYVTAIDNALNAARTPTDQLYYPYSVVPEFNFALLLLIVAIGTTLAMLTSRTTRRKSLH